MHWSYVFLALTHRHINISIIRASNGIRQRLVACSGPCHYLNQCWLIIYWTHANKFYWNFNQGTVIFIKENESENISSKILSLLSRSPCAKRCSIVNLPHHLKIFSRLGKTPVGSKSLSQVVSATKMPYKFIGCHVVESGGLFGCYMYHIITQWRHNEHDGVSNHCVSDSLLNNLFRRWSKNTSKLCVTGPCEGNPPVISGFPSQMASNAENVSIWWRHHVDVAQMRSRQFFHEIWIQS